MKTNCFTTSHIFYWQRLIPGERALKGPFQCTWKVQTSQAFIRTFILHVSPVLKIYASVLRPSGRICWVPLCSCPLHRGWDEVTTSGSLWACPEGRQAPSLLRRLRRHWTFYPFSWIFNINVVFTLMRIRVNALLCWAVCIELQCDRRTLHSINGSMDCFFPAALPLL